MIDVLQYLPPGTKRSPSGWYTFNAPCCVHNGETPDKRKRGGLILDGSDWAYHCFNCGYKTRFVHGQPLSKGAVALLTWMGADETAIRKINFDSIKNRKIHDIIKHRSDAQEEIVHKNIFFAPKALPGDARGILSTDTWAVEYLAGRGLHYKDYDFKITPNSGGRNARRIIIPYKYSDDIVGWTSRFLDDRTPKYLNEHQQPGYVFGLDMQHDDWDYIIACEGILDAVSIKGTALLHNEINEKQAALLRRQGKEVIIVPDQDKPGMVLAEQAIECGFSLSIPEWPDTVKDINDAVAQYGRIATLISIIANKETGKIRTRLAINNCKKRRKIDD